MNSLFKGIFAFNKAQHLLRGELRIHKFVAILSVNFKAINDIWS